MIDILSVMWDHVHNVMLCSITFKMVLIQFFLIMLFSTPKNSSIQNNRFFITKEIVGGCTKQKLFEYVCDCSECQLLSEVNNNINTDVIKKTFLLKDINITKSLCYNVSLP